MLECWRRACLQTFVKHGSSSPATYRLFSTGVVRNAAAGPALQMEEFPCELIRYVVQFL